MDQKINLTSKSSAASSRRTSKSSSITISGSPSGEKSSIRAYLTRKMGNTLGTNTSVPHGGKSNGSKSYHGKSSNDVGSSNPKAKKGKKHDQDDFVLV